MSRARPAALLTATAYAVVLALVLLLPVAWSLNRLTVRLYVLWTYHLHLPGTVSPEDFGVALNVLLFVPVGALGVLALRVPWWWASAGAVALSALVEAVQAIPAVQREASLGDVVANGVGGLVGALIATFLARRSTPEVSADG